jgi:dihydropyrimidine dehydrogenase (NAD+) subunit PreT
LADLLSTDPLGELLPPLTAQEAIVESHRCLNCYDAPCTHACPTHIDVPRFIKKIASGNLIGSAAAILESNLLGATCSRVCPVQELCEGACVLQHEHRPITIGRLQRYAMDAAAAAGVFPVKVSSVGNGKVAVVGSGPAGLSCAGELAKLGYQVTVFEKRDLPGGLSTYGIITLREPKEIALYEVQMLSRLGVKVKNGRELGGSLSLVELQEGFDAVYLAFGLAATPNLGIPGEEHILDGLDYVERSKIRRDDVEVGNHVAVIGAGNTAIDCATIAKRLGSERVTVVYRRTDKEMTAYPHEYEFIKSEGVEFRFLSQPSRVITENGKVKGLECVTMSLGERDSSDRPTPKPVAGSEFVLNVDLIVKAIGQEKPRLANTLGLETERGYLKVSDEFETNLPGVFAGGDCVRAKGAASTVMAVQDGKLAALAIHKKLVKI